MEFLDEQGVQPCGHKAREKGMIIRVLTSCKSNEIPMEYYGIIKGVWLDKNVGRLIIGTGSPLSETQTPCGVDSSHLNCKQNNIDEPCTLQPGYTWRKFNAKVKLVCGEVCGEPAWHYVLLDDDEEVQKKFLAKVASGQVDVADYGTILKSGLGNDPPNEVVHEIHKEYRLSENC